MLMAQNIYYNHLQHNLWRKLNPNDPPPRYMPEEYSVPTLGDATIVSGVNQTAREWIASEDDEYWYLHYHVLNDDAVVVMEEITEPCGGPRLRVFSLLMKAVQWPESYQDYPYEEHLKMIPDKCDFFNADQLPDGLWEAICKLNNK